MENGKKVCTPEEYKALVNRLKTVTVPSGNIFEVKSVNLREYIKIGGLSIKSLKDLQNKDRSEQKELLLTSMSKEEQDAQMLANDKMLIIGVKSPQLSLDIEPGKLCVSDLSDEDYYCLLNAVFNFAGGQDISDNFRKESIPVNS